MIAFSVLVIASSLLLALIFWRRRMPAVLRRIEAFERLNRAVGLAVENGTRLHVSIGHGNLFTRRGGSALAVLALIRRLAERTSASDRPPVVTSGDASLAILSQDTLQSGYHAAGADDQYRYTTARLTGLTPFAYAAGAVPVMRDENVSTNVFIGDFGTESALLVDAAERENSTIVAASDNLSAQSVFYATSQDALIGEELFAVGAYTGAGTTHEASLNAQDVLRWLVILAIIIGSIARFLLGGS